MTDERHYAIELAERLGAQWAKQWLAEPGVSGEDVHSVRSIRVEQWTEEAAHRRWKEIWPGADSGPKKRNQQGKGSTGKRGITRLPDLPKSGDLVECILLAEKTRRGGWKAQLVKLGLVGSITNHEEVPSDAVPNQCVTLRVGAISDDGRHLQWEWQQNVTGGM